MEKRTPTFWRGFHSEGYLIRIERFASRAEASEAVGFATGVAAAQAGRFGVFGARLTGARADRAANDVEIARMQRDAGDKAPAGALKWGKVAAIGAAGSATVALIALIVAL